MYLLLIAVILTILKYMEIGPVAGWSWWVISGVYAATAVWWQVADASGWTKRKAMEKEDRVKLDRQERIRKRLEQGTKGKR